MAIDDNLGPLPVADRNSELQQYSLDALNACLPKQEFVFRDEVKIDAGVDGTIELKHKGHYTNMRANVQLKCCDEQKTLNADGSLSYRIERSNLNYLANGRSPVIIVYNLALRELRFAWVTEVIVELDRKEPDWKTKNGKITIHFSKKLDRNGLAEVYQTVMQKTRLERKTDEILCRASLTERVTVHIDKQSLEITEPDEIKNLLLNGGFNFISAGNAAKVLELADLLSYADKQLPRMLLIRAYAEYVRSRFQAASGHILEATLRREELSEFDRNFLLFMRDVCDYHCGRISVEEYSRRQRDLADATTGEFSLSRRLDSVRHLLLEEDNENRRNALLGELRVIVSTIVSKDGVSSPFKLQASIALIHGEGSEALYDYGHAIFKIQGRRAMGIPTHAESIFDNVSANLQSWLKRASDAAKEAESLGIPQLLGDAIYVRSLIVFSYMSTNLVHAIRTSAKIEMDHQGIVSAHLIPELTAASENYKLTGYVEGELRATLLAADYFDLIGEKSNAVGLAQKVLPIAEAFGFSSVVENAKKHIGGAPFYRERAAQLIESLNEDEDVSFARHSDESMKKFAKDCMELSNLPEDRLPIVTRECLSLRDISREKVNHCKHIDLIQGMRHTFRRETMYATDPTRYCVCCLYRYESTNGSQDWEYLISEFKNDYCMACPDRSPKQCDISA